MLLGMPWTSARSKRSATRWRGLPPSSMNSLETTTWLGGRWFCTCRGTSPRNRVDLLLEAAARLRSRHTRLAVVIIGDGTDESPDLRELTERHGLQDVVRLLGPVYQEAELAKWFLSAEIFRYPSNLGLSVLHAFGYGLAVVTGDVWDVNPPEWQALEDDRKRQVLRGR